MHVLRGCILCIPGLLLKSSLLQSWVMQTCCVQCLNNNNSNNNVPFVTSLAWSIPLICLSAARLRHVHTGFDDHVHSRDVYEPFTQAIVVRGVCRVLRAVCAARESAVALRTSRTQCVWTARALLQQRALRARGRHTQRRKCSPLMRKYTPKSLRWALLVRVGISGQIERRRFFFYFLQRQNIPAMKRKKKKSC